MPLLLGGTPESRNAFRTALHLLSARRFHMQQARACRAVGALDAARRSIRYAREAHARMMTARRSASLASLLVSC